MRIKRWTAGILALVVMIGTMSGCDKFAPKFTEYKVSDYISGLLKSSYKGDNEDFINFTQSSEAEAKENNDLIVENGAVHFCNAYGIYPTDEQMVKIEDIVRTAYSQAEFVVKDHVEVAGGYSVEIEIQPIATFRELTKSFEDALNNVESGAIHMQGEASEPEEGDTSQEEADADENGGVEEESTAEEPQQPANKTIDTNEIFVDEVIRICQEALKNPPKLDPSVTVHMDIKLDEDGILYLDMTQLEQIDETVILFTTVQKDYS